MIRPYTTGPLEPGFYAMPADEYHRDPSPQPSLSSSLSKLILGKSPRHAWSGHPRLNPDYETSESSRAMMLGSVAHELILGKGGGFEVLDFEAFTTKAAKEARDAALAAGKTPILWQSYADALAMESAFRERVSHIEGAEHAFAPGVGHYETVAVVKDTTGAWLRCMIDWAEDGFGTLWDYKTTSIAPSQLSRHFVSMDYDLSAAHYERIVTQLLPDLTGRLKFKWAFQEAKPPFEVSVFELDELGIDMGRRKAAYGIDLWQRCNTAGNWPGYSKRIQKIEYPSFAMKSWLDRELAMEGVDPLADFVPWAPPIERDSGMLTEIAG